MNFEPGYFTNTRRYNDGSMGSYNGYYAGDYGYNAGMSPRRMMNGGMMSGGQYGYGSDYKRSYSPRGGMMGGMGMGSNSAQGMMGTASGMDMNYGQARDGSPRTSPRASPRSSPRRYGREDMY